MVARLIALDLDGTALGDDKRISPYTADVLERAANLGIALAVASGRGRRAAEHVLEGVPRVRYGIYSNGAELYDRSTGRVIRRHALASLRVRLIYATVNALLDGACWAWDTTRGIVADADFRRLATWPGQELDELTLAAPLELRGAPSDPIDRRLKPYGRVLRLLLLHDELPCRQVYDRLEDSLRGALTRSSARFLEITAPRIDKCTALRTLCAELRIPPVDVVAFGDHMNDLTMLQWAGRGIAMCDGDEELCRQIAEHTVAGHDDDGVALTIEELLGL